MVNTRSRTAKNTHSNMNGTDRYSDAESESSVPEVLTREQMNEFDDGNLLDYGDESEHHTVNQRFNEMNKQISELTSLVLALTEKISSNDKASSSNREGNNLNTVSIGHDTRSDNMLLSLPPRHNRGHVSTTVNKMHKISTEQTRSSFRCHIIRVSLLEHFIE